MKTCPYCGSEVVAVEIGNLYDCYFCEMEITEVELQADSNRKPIPFREIVSIEEVYQSTVEFFNYHTYELLCLLRLIRKERTGIYNNMNVFYKARLEGSKEFEEVEKEQAAEYQLYTRKAWVIENILIDRMGHVPERLTDQYLIKFRNDCMRKMKPMQIRQERKNVNGGK